MAFGIFRTLGHGQAKFGRRSGQVSAFAQHQSQGAMSQGMVWIEPDGLAKLGAGRFHIAFEAECESEIVVIFRVGGIQLNRLLQILHRGYQITPVRHDLTQRKIDCRLARLELAGGF